MCRLISYQNQTAIYIAYHLERQIFDSLAARPTRKSRRILKIHTYHYFSSEGKFNTCNLNEGY